MEDISYLPRHRGETPGSGQVATFTLTADEQLNRLRAYSRRSKRGLSDRLDERRALREALRPCRTDHFGGDAA